MLTISGSEMLLRIFKHCTRVYTILQLHDLIKAELSRRNRPAAPC